ncbi:putative biotin biosynthesis protein BioC [Mycobacterium xenopi 4042]|uniref:Putative biotin biosynthesis protein BioC n=1 Tax=Mycobacterium xenopi 4042 TaxID=1299334 RepID=X7Z4R7_MYCXE|nr:putative biotin biosynthesis protein BioC [Mycobacterium xenopi 4042]
MKSERRVGASGGTLCRVPPYRDVAAFDDRAPRYDIGWRGRLHHDIADRTATLAVATIPGLNACSTWVAAPAICSLIRPASRARGIRASAATRWSPDARGPVLVVAGADAVHQPPRQGAHQNERRAPDAARRVPVAAVAQPVCRDHQGGDRHEAEFTPVDGSGGA